MTTPTRQTSALDARYGRSKSTRRRNRWLLIGGGIVLAAILVAWTIWAGLDQTTGNLDSQDIGQTIISDRAVNISYQVSMPSGSTASCALEVQNEAHAIVGWKIVDIPASSQFTNTYQSVVKSSELGVSGLIYQCWLT
ncbi:MAG: hypothetical protein QOG18_736 [Microbacteriaceae bacterium]|jgi:hypothetical protein|nr:hypothetical protein [Microbacteriaceae bacterium]MDQ1526123.1 hypothetical protein [Microbacteriaceae bacterium]